MLQRRIRPKSGIREEVQIRSQGHLKYIRGFECACHSSLECKGRMEAAHVRIGTDGGMSVKPGDNWAIPLCSWHHHIQHLRGEKTFEAHYQINMLKLAQELWAKSPHRIKLERA